MARAIFDNPFHPMGFAHDAHGGIAREGTFGEHFREPFANLLQIAQHGMPSPAISPGNENKLRTQMTADGFRIAHYSTPN
jgi:hypothetical protein